MNPATRSRYYTYIKPVITNKAVRTYSSLIFSLITTIIFLVYAIRPTLTTIASLQKSIEEHKNISQNLKKKVSDLTEGKKNYDVIDEEVKVSLVKLIPYSPSIPSLINELIMIASISEATISALQFQPFQLEKPLQTLSKVPTIKEIDFTINLQGDYNKLVYFLNSLKNADRLINIVSVNFNKPVESSLIMSINGKALYLKNSP